MRSRLGITLLTLLLAIGCQKKPAEEAAAPPQAAATPAPQGAVKKPAAPPAPAPAPIPEQAVKALVDAWLTAQNKGDFKAYEGLYAAKFFGIKRAGQREERFDRDGWLKDRQ
jgi:hypothetical protein